MLDQLTAIGDRARILDLAEEANLSRRSNTSPIVLYGAGPLGQMTRESLRRSGVLPLPFVDSNPKRWETTIGGLPILAPEEAIRRYGDEVRFVVTIYNGHDMRRSLIQKGARSVVHFADLYFEHAVELLPYCGLAPRSVVLGAWPE